MPQRRAQDTSRCTWQHQCAPRRGQPACGQPSDWGVDITGEVACHVAISQVVSGTKCPRPQRTGRTPSKVAADAGSAGFDARQPARWPRSAWLTRTLMPEGLPWLGSISGRLSAEHEQLADSLFRIGFSDDMPNQVARTYEGTCDGPTWRSLTYSNMASGLEATRDVGLKVSGPAISLREVSMVFGAG